MRRALLLWFVVCAAFGCERGGPAAVARSEASPVLIVAVDGATFDRIDPLIARGRLPVLAKLIENGARARLETLEPTVSPAIWTTIATGKLPAEHGILGFEGVPGKSMRTLPTSQMRKVRAVWNILSERGQRVGFVGWWCTWPAEAVNGYMVSDRAVYSRMEAAIRDEGPKPHVVYPDALAGDVAKWVRRPADLGVDEIARFMHLAPEAARAFVLEPQYRMGNLPAEFRYVYQSDRSTADIALHLMPSHPTDVTAVYFAGVDVMSHLAWHYDEPEKFPDYDIPKQAIAILGGIIDRYYEFVDQMTGELVAAAGPDTTVVFVSDHGFGPTGKLPWSGGHGRITPGAPIAPDGVLVLSGPGIRRGMRLASARVLDVAPTLLALRGLPKALDMPGRVLREALVRPVDPQATIATYETSPLPQRSQPALADPELDRDNLEKLRALGYVE